MNSFINTTYDEIKIGQSLTVSRTISRTDVDVLNLVSGDIDEAHIDREQGPDHIPYTESVASLAFFSHLLNQRLPGPGTTILAHNFSFRGHITMGETVSATIIAKEKRPEGHVIVFDCNCTSETGELIASGNATVSAPTTRISYTELATPEVIFRRTDVFSHLILSCEGPTPVICAVVHPCDHDSLIGPIEAAQRNLIIPVLVGPEKKIREAADFAGADISHFRIVNTEHSHEAAEKAVAMARSGEVEALMKGSLHTDELMGAVVPSATGLRTSRRISHVFIIDVPGYCSSRMRPSISYRD